MSSRGSRRQSCTPQRSLEVPLSRRAFLGFLPVCAALSACTAQNTSAGFDADGRLQVVATTPILADVARAVGGERARVHALIPNGADPHSYEPSLRDVRDVAYARLAFTNGLLLEQRKMVAMVSSNLPQGSAQVAVAERIEQYGGKLEPVVEDASLDSIWLGLRVEGTESSGASASHSAESPSDSDASVAFSVTRVKGPGQVAAFITQTFGAVEMMCDSQARGTQESTQDGVRVRTGDMGSLELPLQAHTHLSWAFADAGVYELDVLATPRNAPEGVRQAQGTLHVVVGEDPAEAASRLGANTTVLASGHADIAVQAYTGRLVIRADSGGKVTEHDLARTIIAVPSRTLQEVPAGGQYGFLRGSSREHRGQVYLLAQAVLGKHVHGEIDPHIWHSVPNMKAAAQVMRDALAEADPPGTSLYTANTERVMRELDELDWEIRGIYASLPEASKNLITTHDGYRYLASTYGLTVAGFVTPVAGSEPSIQQRQRLQRTIRDLRVPAIFLDRNTRTRSPVLREVAHENGVQVGTLYSDSLDDEAPHYADMMRANAHTIQRAVER